MAHKLLLADDSVTIQRVIELTFADEDIQLTAVGDGRQAIARIDADPPDIVLADVGMPEKDGYEVAAYIKNTPRLAHIPVLLLTGAFEPVDEARAHAVGCDGVLAKPFEPQMVISRVKELLAGAARRASSPRPALSLAQAPAADAVVTPLPVGPDTPVEPLDFAELSEAFATPADDRQNESEDPVPPAGSAEDDVRVAVSGSDPTFRIRRRQPVVVADTGVPLAESVPDPEPDRRAALDTYFERLDAAFTQLQSGPPAPPSLASGEPDWLQPRREPAPLDLFVLDEFAIDEPLATTPVGDRGGLPAALSDRTADQRERPAIAQAFSALLAAERGEASTGPVPSWFAPPPPPPPPPAPPIDIDALVERVTHQVLQQMSDRVVRETVTDIVSRVTERLVREEIDRIKSSIV